MKIIFTVLAFLTAVSSLADDIKKFGGDQFYLINGKFVMTEEARQWNLRSSKDGKSSIYTNKSSAKLMDSHVANEQNIMVTKNSSGAITHITETDSLDLITNENRKTNSIEGNISQSGFTNYSIVDGKIMALSRCRIEKSRKSCVAVNRLLCADLYNLQIDADKCKDFHKKFKGLMKKHGKALGSQLQTARKRTGAISKDLQKKVSYGGLSIHEDHPFGEHLTTCKELQVKYDYNISIGPAVIEKPASTKQFDIEIGPAVIEQ